MYAIGMQSPTFSLAPNAHYLYHSNLYVGPAVADILHSIALILALLLIMVGFGLFLNGYFGY